jgi:uncharacterized protein (UPF0332 family)
MWKRIKLSSTEEVRVLMVKARRKLELAEYALRAGDYDSAVGDAYRCIELCMRALLLNRGVREIPKTHGGLLQLFTRELVLSGSFPRSLMKEVGKVASIRPIADYTPTLVGIDEASEALRVAHNVLEQSVKILQMESVNS